MAITVVFDLPGVTAAQYDGVITDLESAGLGAPVGRRYHVASAVEGGWQVVDVWDSPDAFEAFGAQLQPLLVRHGIEPKEIRVSPVHNVIAA